MPVEIQLIFVIIMRNQTWWGRNQLYFKDCQKRDAGQQVLHRQVLQVTLLLYLFLPKVVRFCLFGVLAFFFNVQLLISSSIYLYIDVVGSHVCRERKYMLLKIFLILCKYCAHWTPCYVMLWGQIKIKLDLFRWFFSLLSE